MAKSKISGAFVQTKIKFGSNEANIDAAIRTTEKTRADLYVFPELCNTGYAFTSKEECLSLAEPMSDRGASVEKFLAFSEKRRCSLVAGLAERTSEDKTYNSSIVIERGKIVGVYRKMHLFYREKLWFSKSDTGFPVFDLESLGCRIGVMICFDWFFPETARELTLSGAEILCHPSNLVLPGKAQIGTMARAYENRVFVVTANRVGSESRGPKDKFKFTGRSQIVSPTMEKIASAGASEVVAKTATLDLNLARKKDITSLNNIEEDRRVDYYSGQKLEAIVR